jgi:hypothetical protein
MALTKCSECGEAISKRAEKCPKCGAPQKKKTSLFTWLVTIIVVLWAIGYFSGNRGTGTTSTANSEREPSPKQVAIDNVKLDFSWDKEGFGNIMEATFTVTNNSQYQIRDIEIKCTHYAKSGTRIDSNERTIYDVVPAKGKKTFEKFNVGFIHSQAEKTACVITDLKI